MQTYIFTEESNTTAENRDRPVSEYYQGLFGIVSGLHDDLSEFTKTHLRVLSEEYGVADGEQKMSAVGEAERTPVGTEEMAEQTKAELLTAAAEADVMIILLSTDVFQATVTDVWNELVDAAKPDSVWCLGAARSSLEEIDSGGLEAKGCTVLTYRRVGVAHIGSETREELLEIIKKRATQ